MATDTTRFTEALGMEPETSDTGTSAEGDRLQEATTAVVDRARQTTETQISTRVDQAADRLDDVALAVRETGDSLRQADQKLFGTVADRAAEQVQRMSGYLRGKDANRLLADAEDFARREPVIFLGAALAAGWFAARFLKSGPPRESAIGLEERRRAMDDYDAGTAGV